MLVYIHMLGNHLAMVQPINPVDPGYGHPGWGGVDPGYGIETHPHPDQGLPLDPAHPGQLPVWPGYPTTGPVFPGKPVDPGFGIPPGNVWWPVDPGYGRPVRPPRPGHDLPHLPGIPDNSLPTTPPPHVPTGTVIVLARDPAGVWHWAAIPSGTGITPLPVPPPTAAPKA